MIVEYGAVAEPSSFPVVLESSTNRSAWGERDPVAAALGDPAAALVDRVLRAVPESDRSICAPTGTDSTTGAKAIAAVNRPATTTLARRVRIIEAVY